MIGEGNVKIGDFSASKDESCLWKRILSALFFGLSSFLILIVNKNVLTNYSFPSFQVLGVGQLLVTILILDIAKSLNFVSFPRKASNIPIEKFVKVSHILLFS